MNEHVTPPMGGNPFPQELPHNIEAEQALLGAILLDNRAMDRVAFLAADHFHEPLHGEIFDAIGASVRKGRVASPVTLKTLFEGREGMNDAGLTIPQYLGTLAANAATIINAPDYARTIYDLYVRRQIIAVGMRAVADAFNSAVDAAPAQIIDETETALDGLRLRERNERQVVTAAKAMADAVDLANAAHMSGTGLAGLSTGLPHLDAKMGGLSPGNLIILGGRPAMGKTALATNIAANVARAGTGVAFFTLEMSAAEIGHRLLAAETGIAAAAQRRGEFGDDAGMQRLMEGVRQYQDVPFYIDETGGLTLPQLAVRARRLARSRRLGLLVVDYLQLMNGSQYRNTNRVQDLTEITTGLKALAKELSVPLIALSQLNRGLESRDDKRPQLADLRESGSIEQDADVVLFCYRDEYYAERAKPAADDKQHKLDEWEARMQAARGKADVIIAKHRHGPVGTVELNFDGPRTLFTDRG